MVPITPLPTDNSLPSPVPPHSQYPQNLDGQEARSTRSKIGIFLRVFFVLALFAIVGGAAFFATKSTHIIAVEGSAGDFPLGLYEKFSVEKEDNRIDVLILGMRGAGDENGGLLSDTIMLASYDKKTGKAALVSIPRDLYVELPDSGKKVKINAAHAFGEEKAPHGGGIALAKQMVSYVTGVYVDYAVVINFKGFARAIDLVGGVSVTRATPLRESEQWMFEGKENNLYWHVETDVEGKQKWVFEVPSGTSLLTAQDALYYVRSRFTTSDFDRMHRQQQVMSAFVKKVLSLGVLSNPVRVSQLLDALKGSVQTDAGISEMQVVVDLLRSGIWSSAPRYVLDTTNFLTNAHEDSQYVLLPQNGSFEDMRNFFRTLLDDQSTTTNSSVEQ